MVSLGAPLGLGNVPIPLSMRKSSKEETLQGRVSKQSGMRVKSSLHSLLHDREPVLWLLPPRGVPPPS